MDNSVMSMPDETNRSKHFQIFGHNFLNIPQFSLKTFEEATTCSRGHKPRQTLAPTCILKDRHRTSFSAQVKACAQIIKISLARETERWHIAATQVRNKWEWSFFIFFPPSFYESLVEEFGWMSGSPLLFLYLSLKTGLQTSEEQKLIPSIKSLDVTDSLKSGWPRVRNTETKTKRGETIKEGE